MPQESREERRLMRMRGAGVKELKNPHFSFVFGSSSNDISVISESSPTREQHLAIKPAQEPVDDETRIEESSSRKKAVKSQSKAQSSKPNEPPKKRGRPRKDAAKPSQSSSSHASATKLEPKTRPSKKLSQDSGYHSESDDSIKLPARAQSSKHASLAPLSLASSKAATENTQKRPPKRPRGSTLNLEPHSDATKEIQAMGLTAAVVPKRQRAARTSTRKQDQTLDQEPLPDVTGNGERNLHPTLPISGRQSGSDRHGSKNAQKPVSRQSKMAAQGGNATPVDSTSTGHSIPPTKTPSDSILEHTIRKAVTACFRRGDFESLTVLRIRTAVETALALQPAFFKQHGVWNAKSKAIINSQVEAQQREEHLLADADSPQSQEDAPAQSQEAGKDEQQPRRRSRIPLSDQDKAGGKTDRAQGPVSSGIAATTKSIYPIPNLQPRQPAAPTRKPASRSSRPLTARSSNVEPAQKQEKVKRKTKKSRIVDENDDDSSVLESNGYMDKFPLPKVPTSLAAPQGGTSRFKFRL